MTPEEMCEASDDADPTALRAAMIAVLREDEGAEFRELLARLPPGDGWIHEIEHDG